MQKIFNKDGFVWWIGIVEDRLDPEKMGRCRIRIYGYHSDDKTLLPTEDLPWAIPVQPIYSAAISGIGTSPVGPLPGTWVVGFFVDGNDMQQPIFFGTLGSRSAPVTFTPPDDKPTVANKNEGKLLDSFGNPVLDGFGNPVSAGVPSITGWELGQTSEKYETGGRGASTINNYKTSEDRGGASYGTYQLASYLPEKTPKGKSRPSSKNSPVLTYIKQSKFQNMLGGLTPGTNEFDLKWKEVASLYPKEFEKDQHDYVKSRYYDVMISNLKREGLDLTQFGPAVQDLVWSTAVQLGPSRTSIFTVPLKDKSKLTDRDVVNLVSEYKLQNVEKFFKSSGASIIAGVASRYSNEKQDLLNLVA